MDTVDTGLRHHDGTLPRLKILIGLKSIKAFCIREPQKENSSTYQKKH